MNTREQVLGTPPSPFPAPLCRLAWGSELVGVKDEKVSVGCAVAYGAWAVAAGFLIATVGADEMRLFACMMFALGVAVTATIRTYFVEFSAMVRRAFEMDHDSVTPLPRRR